MSYHQQQQQLLLPFDTAYENRPGSTLLHSGTNSFKLNVSQEWSGSKECYILEYLKTMSTWKIQFELDIYFEFEANYVRPTVPGININSINI